MPSAALRASSNSPARPPAWSHPPRNASGSNNTNPTISSGPPVSSPPRISSPTGSPASASTEPGSASGTGLLDIRSRQWSKQLIDFIDPALASKLPPIGEPDQPRGLLRPALAREWGLTELVQVGAGSASPMLAALAAGCVVNGTVAVELGATGVIAGVGAAPVIDYRGEIASLCSATGSWLGLGTTTNAAVVPEVLRRHYGWSAEQFESMVASVSPGADGLLLLPYFTAESIPRLPDGTGVLHGITAENFTPAHMARAAAEGVALGLGYAMSRLRELGFEPPEIRLLGPGAPAR